ncbi:energy-coupling factor transporter transmembrane component T family protein [Candidatus Phytoplasma pini]|uniref:ABC-type cobalt transport protein CbiQ n=1 Tax=Candidatus Phytoplasma pini TaxID=267362 RepID=A0A559KJN0_9MOLU|nr:energy-coupling factor transporter transmembrane component T [Candidatus Phytoplasma pini]TVY12330.1 ABC-type cobalt transport protein CbiQ [Candidatus Phytoplasma pini]
MKIEQNDLRYVDVSKKKSFLFFIHPSLKIILMIFMYRIIFALNIDFVSQEKFKFILYFVMFLLFIFCLIGLLINIDFSHTFSKLLKQILNLHFLVVFSLIIHLSFKPQEKSIIFYTWKNINIFLFLFFIILFFYPPFAKKYIKYFFLLFLFLFVFLIPFWISKFPNKNILSFQKNDIQKVYLQRKDILQIFLIVIRLSLIFIINIIISETTSFIEINDGLEILLKPLKKIKFPVEIFSLMISLIFSSIPFLLIEIKKILKAQTARGLDFNTKNIFKKVYYLVSLLIPIFVLTFHKSYVLADAMETRGYVVGKSRTKLTYYKINKNNYYSIFFVLFFYVFFVFL